MAGMALGLWRAASDQLLDLEAKIMQQVSFPANGENKTSRTILVWCSAAEQAYIAAKCRLALANAI